WAQPADCGTNPYGTYIHALTQPAHGNESIENYFQRSAGYRFFLSDAQYPRIVHTGASLDLTQVWFQRAVSKLFRPYRIKAYLDGQSGSIDLPSVAWPADTWASGPGGPYPVVSSFTVPSGTPTGWYMLKFAIVDSSELPAMNLAI